MQHYLAYLVHHKVAWAREQTFDSRQIRRVPGCVHCGECTTDRVFYYSEANLRMHHPGLCILSARHDDAHAPEACSRRVLCKQIRRMLYHAQGLASACKLFKACVVSRYQRWAVNTGMLKRPLEPPEAESYRILARIGGSSSEFAAALACAAAAFTSGTVSTCLATPQSSSSE